MLIIPTIQSEEPTYSDPFELSCWFNYKPLILPKRIKYKQTLKGNFTQKTNPITLPGVSYLEWSLEAHTPGFVDSLVKRYYYDSNYVFKGKWGEEYLIEFSELNSEPSGGIFSISGKFRVLCITKNFNPTCVPL
jgi:hypothetical protein